jgi:cytochrome c-type biogenesis protein CcmH
MARPASSTAALIAALAALAVALALALAAAAPAAQPRASLPDVEDEVMCVECGTALNVSQSAVADREREFIRRLIAEGKTKQEIKDALVAQFGPAVLASPQEKGFNLAVYVVPPLLVLLAAAVLVTTARRWRRVGEMREEPALDDDDARRLERDMASYDL